METTTLKEVEGAMPIKKEIKYLRGLDSQGDPVRTEMGDGSKIDADTLDGMHAQFFLEYGYIMQRHIVDASKLDQNTYYPVVFKVFPNRNTRIECIVGLNSNSKPSWGSHSSKEFSVRKIWETFGQDYGIQPSPYRRVFVSDYRFAPSDPVRGIGQLQKTSEEYVYVRGGGKYYFFISNNRVTPILKTTEYTSAFNEKLAPTTTPPTEIKANIVTTDITSKIADLEARIAALEAKQ